MRDKSDSNIANTKRTTYMMSQQKTMLEESFDSTAQQQQPVDVSQQSLFTYRKPDQTGLSFTAD